MQIDIIKASEEQVAALRKSFLEKLGNQFVYDKCHYYNWCDNYLFVFNGKAIGYGSIWGSDDRRKRDSIFEFYLRDDHMGKSDDCFKMLMSLPGVKMMECQTNDDLLTNMLFRFAKNINAEAILFEEANSTSLKIDGALFRRRKDDDIVIREDDGPEVLEHNGTIVAHGGLMYNYNLPYADVYMHVLEGYRGKGYGSLIVQELKKLAYEMGRVPAARCNVDNVISKATLEKAGFRICGFRVNGDLTHHSA